MGFLINPANHSVQAVKFDLTMRIICTTFALNYLKTIE
jgi:hypothetical protein